jgi:hypothetical protein
VHARQLPEGLLVECKDFPVFGSRTATDRGCTGWARVVSCTAGRQRSSLFWLRSNEIWDCRTGSRSKSTAGDLVNDPAGPVTTFGGHARL